MGVDFNKTPRRPANDSIGAQLNPSVGDQVATGTDKILESPHISEGPGRIANSPVPSVYVRFAFLRDEARFSVFPVLLVTAIVFFGIKPNNAISVVSLAYS